MDEDKEVAVVNMIGAIMGNIDRNGRFEPLGTSSTCPQDHRASLESETALKGMSNGLKTCQARGSQTRGTNVQPIPFTAVH